MKSIFAHRILAITCLLSLGATPAFGIMNGRDADPVKSAHSISIQISVQAYPDSRADHSLASENCTAVIVSRHLLLTAGHCFEGAPTSQPSIRGSSGKYFHNLTVLRWSAAPGYVLTGSKQTKSGADIQRDLAYIVTSEDLLENFGLQPQQVPNLLGNDDQIQERLKNSHTAGMAYGFGDSTGENVPGVTIKRGFWATVFAADDGKKELGVTIEHEPKFDNFLTHSSELGRGQCQGDSGGGLFIEGEAGHPQILLGVLSGINTVEAGKCSQNAYAAYANITPHICWIQKSSGISLGKTDCP